MEKHVPLFPLRTLLYIRIEPPSLLMIPYATHRPRPIPCSPLVVKNGSKSRTLFFAGIPTPVSAIVIRTPSTAGLLPLAALRTRIEMVPPVLVASIAFTRRVATT